MILLLLVIVLQNAALMVMLRQLQNSLTPDLKEEDELVRQMTDDIRKAQRHLPKQEGK